MHAAPIAKGIGDVKQSGTGEKKMRSMFVVNHAGFMMNVGLEQQKLWRERKTAKNINIYYIV